MSKRLKIGALVVSAAALCFAQGDSGQSAGQQQNQVAQQGEGATQTGAADIGELQSSDVMVSGAVTLEVGGGAKVRSGAQMTAGTHPAVLKLKRGGSLRLCPGTSATITASRDGSVLMVGMNGGAVEAEYSLAAGSDTILTPDLRMALTGPGSFHFAAGVNNRGDTCVASRAGDDAAVIVSEMFGERSYQVRPGTSVWFAGGKLEAPAAPPGECGCPAVPESRKVVAAPFPEAQSRSAAQQAAANPSKQIVKNVGGSDSQVEMPIVFDANALPPSVPSVAELRRQKWVVPPIPEPRPAAPPSKKKWYQKIAAFFKGQ